jgi:hypothetical protein
LSTTKVSKKFGHSAATVLVLFNIAEIFKVIAVTYIGGTTVMGFIALIYKIPFTTPIWNCIFTFTFVDTFTMSPLTIWYEVEGQ